MSTIMKGFGIVSAVSVGLLVFGFTASKMTAPAQTTNATTAKQKLIDLNAQTPSGKLGLEVFYSDGFAPLCLLGSKVDEAIQAIRNKDDLWLKQIDCLKAPRGVKMFLVWPSPWSRYDSDLWKVRALGMTFWTRRANTGFAPVDHFVAID